MSRTGNLRRFLSEYQCYTTQILQPVHEEIRSHLSRWLEPAYWARFARTTSSAYPSPIRTVLTRIKRPERVVDKILQKPEEFPEGLAPPSFRRMHDTIGVRIIVYFLSHLPLVDRELRDSETFEISSEHPPEAYGNRDLLQRFGLSHIPHKEKESGYSSIHYVLRLKTSTVPQQDRPWFEMQVRTLAQELWSEMEHILAYKSQRRTDLPTRRRLQILSREIGAIDEHFNLLNEELLQKQESPRYRREDHLNAENLPATLAEIGMRCAQQDLNVMLSLLYSRGIRKVGDLLRVATPRRLETIRNTYVSALGRLPESLELIATLGTLNNLGPKADEVQHILSQIEYSRFWDRFRRENLLSNAEARLPRQVSS